MRIRHWVLAGCLAAPGAHAADSTLEKVIVTATRAPTELLDFAGSIDRIDNDQIKLQGATHHSEILNSVPGANFQRNSGQESLTAIRSPVLAGPGSCGSFLFLEDSVPIRPVGFCNVNELFEINFSQAEAIEVQRGPASAIYGSSAMHGAINVLTRDPANMPRVAVGVDVGEDSFIRGDLGVAYHGDSFAAGLSGNYEKDGGWRDDSEVKQSKINGAYSQKLESSTFDVKISHVKLDQDTAGFIQGFEAYRNEDIARTNPDPDAYRNARATRLVGHWNLPLSDQTVIDLRPYARTSRMEFLQHFLPGKPLEQNGQDSGGLISTFQHTFDGGAHLLAGIDLEYASSFLQETQFTPTVTNRPFGKHYDYTVKSNVAALYGQWDQPFGDAWTATLGVRGEYVGYDYDNRMIDGVTDQNGVACTPICVYRRPADSSDNFKNLTPKLSLSWRWTEGHATYVTVVRGYRAPETTELYRLQRQQSSADLDSERLDSVEIGARGTVSILNYAIGIFAMRKENFIFRDSQFFNVSNGKTQHRGVEYELGWTPVEPLHLSFAGTWARHTYDFSALAESNEVITSGNDVDTAPQNLWNARALWKIYEGISTELEWQHVGGYYTDPANTRHYDGHDLLHLRASWSFADSWQIIGRLNNVMDRRYADRADAAFGNDRYFPGRGRAGFVEVRYEYK